jgi:hypothetical protein
MITGRMRMGIVMCARTPRFGKYRGKLLKINGLLEMWRLPHGSKTVLMGSRTPGISDSMRPIPPCRSLEHIGMLILSNALGRRVGQYLTNTIDRVLTLLV